jgi:hypothetical protein
MQYQKLTDEDDLVRCLAIIESIEQRWIVADQEIFIAAVVLNPFYQCTPFAAHPFLNNAGIHTLLCHLWIRFYTTEPPADFFSELNEYLNRTGRYANFTAHCNRSLLEAEHKVLTTRHVGCNYLTAIGNTTGPAANLY